MDRSLKIWMGLLAMLLVGCSSNDRLTFDQESMQSLIDDGFLAPQICTLEMTPLMNVQLYLDAPQLDMQGDHQPLMFQINGSIDAELLGGVVLRKIPVKISGFTQLRYSDRDRAVFMDKIEFLAADIDLDVAVFKATIIESFQTALQKELLTVPLITFLKHPDTGEKLEMLSRKGRVMFDVQDKLLTAYTGMHSQNGSSQRD